MKIAFRVDSSTDIGSGHLVRCVTLADFLKRQGHITQFLCRDHPGHLADLVTRHGHKLHLLSRPAEEDQAATGSDLYARWLGVSQEKDAHDTVQMLHREGGVWHFVVMDHYGLDQIWQRRLRPYVKRLFVIDDLADRTHDCDVLLDQNLNAAGTARYQGLVPDSCTLLCGPKYALLRGEFEAVRKKLRSRDGSVRRILVFYGGMDATGETIKACEALQSMSRSGLTVDVVVGMGNPCREDIRARCERYGFNFLRQVDKMAELMAVADLALGAGGTTSAERAFLGLPTVITPVAENQKPGSAAFASAGAAWNLEDVGKVTSDSLAQTIRRLLENRDEVKAVGEKALALFEGSTESGVHEAARVMEGLSHA